MPKTMMKYRSVQGKCPVVGFQQAAFQGLAPDGSLYVPQHFPKLPRHLIENLPHYDLHQLALEVVQLFITDIPEEILTGIVKRSLNFAIPLTKLAPQYYLLELFHGPTLAFKDVGARFMAEVLSHYLSQQRTRLTIITATSGDTGSAVAHGFHNIPNIDVFVLYPSGKVSPLQEQQMTTLGDNIHALEVSGVFDDCQLLVKQALADKEIMQQCHLTTANSINIARLVPQIIYYVWALAQWRQLGHREPPLLVVPSGNLGNLTAAAYAKTMGLPLGQLVAATNANTVVPDYLRSGEFMPRPSMPTLSSAMDVGNPSNLTRLQALYDDDIDQIQTHIMGIGVTDEQTLATIRYCYENYQVIIDPHTAVGVAAAKILMASAAARLPAIIAATAHPAKFPETIYQALTLNVDLPPALTAVMDKPKQSVPLANDFSALKTILLNHVQN